MSTNVNRLNVFMEDMIDEALLARLKQCKDLPTPPAVAAKIIELSDKETSDVDTLASIVAMDPALSAKILSIANSSLYMRKVEADSIQNAVAMFGWKGTLNIALSFAVVGSIRGTLSSGIDYDYFWKRSLAAATAARALGQVAGHANEELLFLPGLLQDIGMLAVDRATPELYSGVADKQQDHVFLQELEKENVNSDHAKVGEWLLTTWKIPVEVTSLVGLSHAPSYPAEHEQEVISQKCIFLSGYLADCLLVEESRQDIQAIAELMRLHMSISMSDFLPLIGHIANHFIEMASMFEIDVADMHRLLSIQEMAKLTLLPDNN